MISLTIKHSPAGLKRDQHQGSRTFAALVYIKTCNQEKREAMYYFTKVNSLKDLKSQYRRLAMKYHPDVGGPSGSLDTMKLVNLEYDSLYAVWARRHNYESPDEAIIQTPSESRNEFYTAYGWKGDNYNGSLTTTEIAKVVRVYVKKQYPNWKFSITTEYFANGSSISISLMEAPYEIFDREQVKEKAEEEQLIWGDDFFDHSRYQSLQRAINEDNIHLNLHSVTDREKEYLNGVAYQVLLDVYQYVQSFHFEDSDSMIDYFSTNFYLHFGIGKWNKGFRIVPKQEKKDSMEHLMVKRVGDNANAK